MGVGNSGQIYKDKQKEELLGDIQTEQKEEKEAPKLDPVFQKIQELKAEFDKDTDSASQSFSFVKFSLNMLFYIAERTKEQLKDDSGTSREQELRKSDAESAIAHALLGCRNAAVSYYNSHRGHRWSDKGKRRKDLINQMVDATQQAAVSQEMPAFVRETMIDRMIRDTSETGFASKKSREFFSAQAKLESGNKNADEYTYKIMYLQQHKQRDPQWQAEEREKLRNQEELRKEICKKILKFPITPQMLSYELYKVGRAKGVQYDKLPEDPLRIEDIEGDDDYDDYY